MKKRSAVLIPLLLAALVALPAASGPLEGTPGERYELQAPGVEKDMTYFFGPYHVPPGWDANRITVDVPLQTGFIVAVAPELVDARTGEVPSEEVAHIHHAHWLRITNDTTTYEQYPNDIPLSWVFGTGEEKTQGSLDDRAAMEPTGNDWRYGIFIDGTQPQLVIYMIHNKTSQPLNMYVQLRVRMIFGTREQIVQAGGRDIHPLAGTLWGETKDATKGYPVLGSDYTATHDGTAVASAGHLHPGGMQVAVANLGPGGECTADYDRDGFPGVTILHSRKMDRHPEAWPWSEDYQMGASKFGWRAPIHRGDVIRQFGTYDALGGTPPYANDLKFGFPLDGKQHASWEAMSYTGLYVDWEQPPPSLPAGDVCALRAGKYVKLFGARLLGTDTVEVQGKSIGPEWYLTGANEGMLNHPWEEHAEDICGAGSAPPCDDGTLDRQPGLATNVVNVAAFKYVPGDLDLPGVLGQPPQVKQGESLVVVNEDAAANIRHTITSCPLPCEGQYTANYPIPDGVFDSDKIGNFDPIDGGLNDARDVPVWRSPADLPVGTYTYFCRIHPFMRGAFTVVA